jgi:hypothetical protein
MFIQIREKQPERNGSRPIGRKCLIIMLNIIRGFGKDAVFMGYVFVVIIIRSRKAMFSAMSALLDLRQSRKRHARNVVILPGLYSI